MSIKSCEHAREPKRQRGRLRVAAIMQAGAELFSEKGYDAATMTEIAARSRTAIGSLYRFFPSKESLADVLLLAYARHSLELLAELQGRAAELSLEDLAGALVDYKLALQARRSLAVTLVDARGGSPDIRGQFRKAMRDELGKVLRLALEGLDLEKSQAMAAVILHVLKAVPGALAEEDTLRGQLLAELREIVRAYLAAAQASNRQQAG